MPSNDTPKTITLKINGVAPIRKEAVAAGTIKPGYIVDRDSANKFAARSSADLAGPTYIAVENDVIGDGIDDDYSAGDQVQVNVFRPGDEVFMLVAAGHAAIALGDLLQSADDGTVKALASGVNAFRALEAVDNSGGATEARIKVEVI